MSGRRAVGRGIIGRPIRQLTKIGEFSAEHTVIDFGEDARGRIPQWMACGDLPRFASGFGERGLQRWPGKHMTRTRQPRFR